ncbi:hypothetical protein AKJ09_05520 [Labilithrix luteola]|uniref:Outer membrane lipoprotein BamD-like domain-containing protein n=1 Tax=Labilithrix luteola TaxID=1391654 RepID=A0A0K1PZP8_9BACT|nr:tetratricopeptide repeat protein [Labilithrix luteola]AKU98856.1 hypothetical protein AKJ09_05520 [Labilithrix luteola]
MTTPPDPLADALRAALEQEDHVNDDALLKRAIDGAMTSLETSTLAGAKAPARLSRSNVKLLRYALPVAAAFGASVAMASAYFVTRSYSITTAREEAEKKAPQAQGHSASDAPAKANATEERTTEEKTVSIDELPSVGAPAQAPKATGKEPSTARHDESVNDTASAAELFREANGERRAGNVPNAIQLYRSLQSRYPNAAESHASRVSLGRLLLDRQSDPRGALAEFDAYLQVSGDETLAEEARVGRALAFQRLGERDEERRAWLELLQHHPDSLQVPRARQRLEALENSHTP